MYTAKEGTVRYRKEVTDAYSTVIGDWSDPVTVIAPVGPNATMSGLRFDLNRMTALQKTNIGKVLRLVFGSNKQTGIADFVILGQTGSAYQQALVMDHSCSKPAQVKAFDCCIERLTHGFMFTSASR